MAVHRGSRKLCLVPHRCVLVRTITHQSNVLNRHIGVTAVSSGGGKIGKNGMHKGPRMLLGKYDDFLGPMATDLSLSLDAGINIRQPPHDYALRNGMRNANAVSDVAKTVRTQVYEHVASGRVALTIGGDHSIAIGSIAGSAYAVKRTLHMDVGVIWVDSHADIRKPGDLSSGKSGGDLNRMPLAWLSGLATEKKRLKPFYWLDEEHRISLKKLVYVGLRNVSENEQETLSDEGVKVFSVKDVESYGMTKVVEMALDWIGADTPIHLSFDVHALDPIWAPATADPVAHGLSLHDSKLLAQHISESGNLVALDMVEINTRAANRKGIAHTVDSARSIIRCVLGEKAS